jgi:NitT/TauT family transport system substrate-binding protein
MRAPSQAHAPRPVPRLLALLWIATAVAVLIILPSSSASAERIRIAAQATGTLAWELAVMREHGLGQKAGVDVAPVELASTEAGKVALRGGSADMILSDVLWVARERALGSDLVFYPYSSALGAVMVPANSPVQGIADLPGKKLGVAGGALDKSWLLLRALALKSGIDLAARTQVTYGAPPLLSAQALQGRTDATLTFWNFCAGLEGKGFRRAIDMADVMQRLGAGGTVPMLGYVFDRGWARSHASLLSRFFAAAHQAEEILANSPQEWQSLAPRIGATNATALDVYRKRYREGLARRPLAAVIPDAQALYRVLAGLGGAQLVGPAVTLDPRTFYMLDAGG